MLSKRSSQFNYLFDDVLNWNNQLWPTIFRSDLSAPVSLVESSESDGKIKYMIDVPGVTKEQISLTQEGKYIKIEAERTDKSTVSKYVNTFSISPKAKLETLEASLENGVLCISFDSKVEIESSSEPKRIEIKDSVPKLGT
jgi:HSP20 family molecular chaperone IbpA